MRNLRLALCLALCAAVAARAEPPPFSPQDADNTAAMARDVNAREPDGSTALQWAVYRGDVGEVQRLIKAGADVRIANAYGATPMSLGGRGAATLRSCAVLLKAGADARTPPTPRGRQH